MKVVRMCWMMLLAAIVVEGAVFADMPPTYTAKQLQTYSGVNEGDRVHFVGIVSVESGRYGYSTTVACDPGGGPEAFIAVYDRQQRLAAERGQIIDVVGVLVEYYDKTEINCSDETEFPPTATADYGTVPEPMQITCAQADTEPYESCLIMLQNVRVLSEPDTYGNIAISDGTKEFVLLLRKIDPAPSVGFVYECLTGDNDYHFGEFKLRPRDEGDWVCSGQPTPTPTPTSGDCAPTLDLYFDGHQEIDCFTGGDLFHAMFQIYNTCTVDWEVDLYIVLQVAGYYYFFPNWTSDLDKTTVSIRAGGLITGDILPEFYWPTGAGAFSDLSFIGVMTMPEDIYKLVGNVEIMPFCYQ